MSETVYSSVNYTLAGLMQKIKLGEVALPDIQRPFVWANAKVRDLFDSLYRGYPVGYLLLWSSAGDQGYSQIGIESKQVAPNLLIVDGQQRLTSLYAVFECMEVVRSDYTKERIHISFHPINEKFSVADAAIRKNPEYIPDISALWKPGTNAFTFTNEFIQILGKHRNQQRLRHGETLIDTPELCPNEINQISGSIGKLFNLTNYPLIALQLSSSVSEEQVAEVFVRINSQGATLIQADFILTLMSVFWDEGRHELERFCRLSLQPSVNDPSPYNSFIKPNPADLLRVSVGLAFRRARLEHVYSILRGKDMTTGHFSPEQRDMQFSRLKQAQTQVLNLNNWHEFFKCLLRAGYRRDNMITSGNALLYAYTFFLIGKRDFLVNHQMLREVIARWFFMSSLTSRYANSPETRMAQDLNLLDNVTNGEGFIQLLDGIIADSLTEDYWNITLPNDLATSSANSPSLNAYYASLVLLDAKVLFSDMKVSDLLNPMLQAKRSAVERHHLFPRNYLKSLGVVETRDINQIANFALVEWTDNIDISDSSPINYLQTYVVKYNDSQIEELYHWHALPEGWEYLDYQKFLTLRRKKIATVTREGFEKL